MKKILKLVFIVSLFGCGATLSAARVVQPSVDTKPEAVAEEKAKKQAKERQAVKPVVVKKKKGSKGLMRAFIGFGGAVIGANVGFVASKIAFVVIVVGAALITPVAAILAAPLLVIAAITPLVGIVGGAYYGAKFGLSLFDDLHDDYELVYVSVPDID